MDVFHRSILVRMNRRHGQDNGNNADLMEILYFHLGDVQQPTYIVMKLTMFVLVTPNFVRKRYKWEFLWQQGHYFPLARIAHQKSTV